MFSTYLKWEKRTWEKFGQIKVIKCKIFIIEKWSNSNKRKHWNEVKIKIRAA